jgi:(S)-2-hydroxy-acid oxidase
MQNQRQSVADFERDAVPRMIKPAQNYYLSGANG